MGTRRRAQAGHPAWRRCSSVRNAQFLVERASACAVFVQEREVPLEELRVAQGGRARFRRYASDVSDNGSRSTRPVLSPKLSAGTPALSSMPSSRLAIGVSSVYLM